MVTAEMISKIPITDAKRPNVLGSFAFNPADVRAYVINRVLADMLRGRTALENLRIGNEAKRLKNELQVFNAHVRNPKNYPNDSRDQLISSFQDSDATTLGLNTNARVSARLSKFAGIHVVLDYDNTVTDASKQFDTSGIVEVDPKDYRITFIPGSVIAESLLAENRDNFPEVFASTWQILLKDKAGYDAFRLSGKEAPLREGISNFFRYAKGNDIELTVASANFEPFVMGGLDRIAEAEGTRVIAVTPDSIISISKGDLLLHLAQKDPTRATIFVGDGASDLPALHAKDVVACYFALERSAFEKQLRDENIPYFPYRDFNDIQLKLKQLKAR